MYVHKVVTQEDAAKISRRFAQGCPTAPHFRRENCSTRWRWRDLQAEGAACFKKAVGTHVGVNTVAQGSDGCAASEQSGQGRQFSNTSDGGREEGAFGSAATDRILISTVFAPNDAQTWLYNHEVLRQGSRLSIDLQLLSIDGECTHFRNLSGVTCIPVPTDKPKLWYRCRHMGVYAQYHAIWMLDGDIQLTAAPLSRFIDIWLRLKPLISQPTILPKTQAFWPFNDHSYSLYPRLHGIRALQTRFIEQQAPLLRREVAIPFMRQIGCPLAEVQEVEMCSWATDQLWCKFAEAHRKSLRIAGQACVVIVSPVIHTNSHTLKKTATMHRGCTRVRKFAWKKWPQFMRVIDQGYKLSPEKYQTSQPNHSDSLMRVLLHSIPNRAHKKGPSPHSGLP